MLFQITIALDIRLEMAVKEFGSMITAFTVTVKALDKLLIGDSDFELACRM
jgi:hypothetical protein